MPKGCVTTRSSHVETVHVAQARAAARHDEQWSGDCGLSAGAGMHARYMPAPCTGYANAAWSYTATPKSERPGNAGASVAPDR
ncbi:hypothetical protein XFF6992_510106 [Xanthomonas citri pv. fuscans]|nr:hypothetical protein XFF6992_510106 [Xanthomonas citri pv. fuscans]